MRLLPIALALAAALHGHVGSPDVFYEGTAGPYRLLVTIRPPVIVPGVAEIEIRSAAPGVREMRIVPLPLTGAGAKFAPAPDVAQRSKQDPQFFTGSLWLMLLLAVGIVSIVGAGVREGQLEPGQQPSPARIRRARIMMAGTAALVT